MSGYLSQFMWTRNCKIRGVDRFDQILGDIAKYYDPTEWRTWTDPDIFKNASTERQQMKLLRRGLDLVRLIVKVYYHSEQHALFKNFFINFQCTIFKAAKKSHDGVVTDAQGRVVLGGSKFLILSKRLVRNKVRINLLDVELHSLGLFFKIWGCVR